MTRLSRRRFLTGTSTLFLLPAFQSLIPRVARAQQTEKRLRFVGFFHPNGANLEQWTPGASETLQLSPTLMPLAGVRDYVNVFSGLQLAPNDIGSHEGGQRHFLTGHKDIVAGQTDSLDQIVAAQIRDRTVRGSLELGLDDGGYGQCNDVAHCHVAFKAGTPLGGIYEPRELFQLIFGAPVGGMPVVPSAEADAKQNRLRKSVLDAVLGDARELSPKLGAQDRQKLDEYLTGVREIERTIQISEQPNEPAPVSCTAGAAPGPKPGDPAVHSPIMLDLLFKAFECDHTRVATFMFAKGVSDRSYASIGVPESHHGGCSHHGGNRQKLEWLHLIDRWMVSQIAYLAEKMAAVREGDGTMLDNAILYHATDIADGDRHNHQNMPILTVGRAGGAFRTGRHLRMPGENTGNLFLSFLRAFGIERARFGDHGTAPLDLS